MIAISIRAQLAGHRVSLSYVLTFFLAESDIFSRETGYWQITALDCVGLHTQAQTLSEASRRFAQTARLFDASGIL